MDATTAARPGPASGASSTNVNAARVFYGDARLAILALNHLRLMTLKRVFGIPPEAANALTFVLALSAADATLRGATRAARAARPAPADAAMGGFLVREAAFGVVGPGAREFPLAATLLAGAMIAGIGLPGLRRAARGLRAAEHHVREQRIRTYTEARDRMAKLRDRAE
jgi:hypothetical protein